MRKGTTGDPAPGCLMSKWPFPRKRRALPKCHNTQRDWGERAPLLAVSEIVDGRSTFDAAETEILGGTAPTGLAEIKLFQDQGKLSKEIPKRFQ